eukprot:scaffold162571_cov16-Tisochrysis_lutea.AAC.1
MVCRVVCVCLPYHVQALGLDPNPNAILEEEVMKEVEEILKPCQGICIIKSSSTGISKLNGKRDSNAPKPQCILNTCGCLGSQHSPPCKCPENCVWRQERIRIRWSTVTLQIQGAINQSPGRNEKKGRGCNQRHMHSIRIEDCEDTRPGQQVKAAERQHADLYKNSSGKAVTLNTILLG